MKKHFIIFIFLLCVACILFGCSPSQPTEEEIMSYILLYLQPEESDDITRTFGKIQKVDKNDKYLLYSIDVIESRQSDEYNPYFVPDYKVKIKYYIQYKLERNRWFFDHIFFNEDELVFENIEETDMDLFVDANFEGFDSYEIIDSKVDLEKGKVSYTLNLYFDGEYFSKVTEASFDLQLYEEGQKHFVWKVSKDPELTDNIYIKEDKVIGKWGMRAPNDVVMSIDIKDISNGQVTLYFTTSEMGLSEYIEWIGEQDINRPNTFKSGNDSLILPTEKEINYILLNGQKFYKW